MEGLRLEVISTTHYSWLHSICERGYMICEPHSQARAWEQGYMVYSLVPRLACGNETTWYSASR